MESKKKVLILCSNLGVGGFQRSLLSLLMYFDYSKYDVDLQLFDYSGMFINQLPREVKLRDSIIDQDYFSSGPKATISMLKKGKIKQFFYRALSCIVWPFDKGIGAEIMAKGIPSIQEKYDVVIDYNGQQQLYYMVNSINADKKITYFHSDYKKWRYYETADRKYYGKVDAIVSVSDECVTSLKDVFPEYAEKIYKIENIVTKNTVSCLPLDSPFADDSANSFNIVTIARVCKDKGFDLACEAVHRLIEKDQNIKWFFVGPITDSECVNESLNKYETSGRMILPGATDNPYRWMYNADLIVLPSRFEGKSVTVEEAKVLGKVIVITNYSTASDQIRNGENGLITDMNAYSIAEMIEAVIKDTNNIRSSLQLDTGVGNEFEINELYKLINA